MSRSRTKSIDKLRCGTLTVQKIIQGGDPFNENPTETPGGTTALISATMVVGTEALNVINVTVQLEDGAGDDMARASCIAFYLSSDADGQVLEGTGPDTIAIGTDGVIIPSGGDSVITGMLVSEADGDIDLDITKTGADTFYLNLVMPDGSLSTSGVITFDSTT